MCSNIMHVVFQRLKSDSDLAGLKSTWSSLSTLSYCIDSVQLYCVTGVGYFQCVTLATERCRCEAADMTYM